MGGIVNRPKRVPCIKPTHVWITTASATWTNQKGAQILAKRRAGISEFVLVPVARIENTPFKIVSREEFLPHIEKSPYVYMYGAIIDGVEGKVSYGDVSALTTETWGSINHAASVGTKHENPYSRKFIMAQFESEAREQSPEPITRLVTADEMREGKHTCMVVAALIAGEVSDY